MVVWWACWWTVVVLSRTLAYATFARFGRAITAWRWSSEWRCGTCGRALQPGGSFVRSLGRSGLCSEVRPCLSCCTERAHEMTSSS